ncbi:melanocyte-stimulating hormone receptor-like [Stylophora pistillata]|uniref:melanocyte-stimulating hormone receptor-like n=1 Tax=Stylophora pistillata TaxID=50429 RepID=UPI000C04BC49|nr:melanocyte-stimulating hormone receptor-like [Stylophora pistillata]
MDLNSTQKCYFLTSLELSHEGSIYASEIAFCAVNSVFSVIATTWNILVILVIWKTPLLHSPSNILICCLACSDLVIGLLAQPMLVTYKIAELQNSANTACIGRLIHWIVGFVCAGVSVLTICAISVDKVAALHWHLRYGEKVTVVRVLRIICAFWLFCISTAVSLFLADTDRYWTLVPLPVLAVTLTTTFVAYIKVFKVLRRHQKQIQSQTRSAWEGVNIRKYKKSVITMVYLLAMFLVCYTPFLMAMAVRLLVGYSSGVKMAYEWGATIVYLNSSLNPLVYWLRMQDIRLATYNAIRKILGNESRFESKVLQFSNWNIFNDNNVSKSRFDISQAFRN